MDNKKVAAGLNGILNPTPAQVVKNESRTKADRSAQGEEKAKGKYKTVCYSIPPEVAERIRYIAWYDRKKINAVVAEAFEQYATRWEKNNPKQ